MLLGHISGSQYALPSMCRLHPTQISGETWVTRNIIPQRPREMASVLMPLLARFTGQMLGVLPITIKILGCVRENASESKPDLSLSVLLVCSAITNNHWLQGIWYCTHTHCFTKSLCCIDYLLLCSIAKVVSSIYFLSLMCIVMGMKTVRGLRLSSHSFIYISSSPWRIGDLVPELMLNG